MAVTLDPFLRNVWNISIIAFVIFDLVNNSSLHEDYLLPYQLQHGSKLNHRQIRECQPIQYGNTTHEIFSSKQKNTSLPYVETKTFAIKLQEGQPVVRGHYSIIRDPLSTFSVLEPFQKGGCSKHLRASVQSSVGQKKCTVAMNAGYFNTTDGRCIGNVISDGRVVQTSHIQNANFGILKNGSIITGYLAEEELNSNTSMFYQLISGVIWLLRNGDVYVGASIDAECPDSQETGSFSTFTKVLSARTAIGHDDKGQLILLHVEGKTYEYGINLWDLAELMKRFGAINAINTDGGGSATYILNDMVVNYPSDDCIDDNSLKCARNVSTVFCIHEPNCNTECSPHSTCFKGRCVCQEPWMGVNCSSLPCDSHNCSNNGICTELGCLCNWGWNGEKCDNKCAAGFWGPNCTIQCFCRNNSTCNHETGMCGCLPGFTGILCDHECPYGWYGLNCKNECDCPSSCSCSHISGICDNSSKQSLEPELEKCILQNSIHNLKLVPFQSTQYRLWIILTVIMSCLAFAGIVSTVLLLRKAFQRRNKILNSSIIKYSKHRNYSSSSDEETYLHSNN